VQQFIKKHRRPLPELIEELNLKVVDASKMLQQQHSDSAERPGSGMVSSAAQPGASSTTPPAPQPCSFDVLLARQRHIDLLQNFVRIDAYVKPPPKSNPRQERPKIAFGLLQDCRKYKEDNWLGVEEDKQIDKMDQGTGN